MAEVLVQDNGGATLRLMDYGGKTFRCFFFKAETLRTSHSIPFRSDDILLCSFPKAGNVIAMEGRMVNVLPYTTGCHWSWDITRMLLDGNRKTADGMHKEEAMLENMTYEEAAALKSPRLLSTHMGFSELPEDLKRFKNKVIFVYRNPKDLAVSFYHMHRVFAHYDYSGTFDNYLSLFLSGNVDWGSYCDYLCEWDKAMKENEFDLPFHVICYEHLKRDPMTEIRRLSEFLGKDYDDRFLESIREACSFTSMKVRKGDMFRGKGDENVMYRKGIVGDWKEHFTVARNEEFDDVILEKLSHTQFEFIYE